MWQVIFESITIMKHFFATNNPSFSSEKGTNHNTIPGSISNISPTWSPFNYTTLCIWYIFYVIFQRTTISQLWEKKTSWLKITLRGDMLVPRRIYLYTYQIMASCSWFEFHLCMSSTSTVSSISVSILWLLPRQQYQRSTRIVPLATPWIIES